MHTLSWFIARCILPVQFQPAVPGKSRCSLLRGKRDSRGARIIPAKANVPPPHTHTSPRPSLLYVHPCLTGARVLLHLLIVANCLL